MIRFIYGNPGTGKTKLIYSKILEDANDNLKSLLIVPEQFTVATERDIIKLIPPSTQLNIEVLNFTRLANRLFREHGGLSYNFVSKAHEKLMMWRAIRTAQPFLREYRMLSADDFSLTDAILATHKELSASGISPDQLEEAANFCNNRILSDKIKDISVICSIYNSMLGEKFTDTNSELSRLNSLLRSNLCLNGINVYFDGFTSFTGLEHSIIREILRQADNVTVTLGIPSPTYRGIDTISIKECSDKLRRDCASLGLKTDTITLEKNYRTNSSILNSISSDLWIMDKQNNKDIKGCEHSPVELYKAADIYDECEYAAAKIRELIENGYRYKDIAVIARNIDKYRGIIEPAFDNFELKYFISEKADLSVSPIAKFILSAIRVLTHGWRRSDIIAHLKTGLLPISSHDADIFECYTAKWNINGKSFLNDEPWNMNPDGYTTVRTERGNVVLEIANNVKEQLISNLKTYTSKLKASETYQEMCVATYEYLDDLGVRSSMLSLAKDYLEAGKLREASDYARMFEGALDSLDCVCEALNEEGRADINIFATALRIAFSESDLGSIPTSQDEILLGSANLLRTENVKCAIILGACDGEFPASAANGGLLSVNDRKYLAEYGLQISGNQEETSADELYYFRRAVSSSSEKLIVFTRGDSEPSLGFTRLLNILAGCKVNDTASLLIPRLRSLKAVSEYAPLFDGSAEGMAMQKLLNELGVSDSDNKLISVTAEDDKINKQTVQSIIGNELSLSQSKAELFVNCKFAYSCKYHLRLDDGKAAEFSFSNIGTFIHHILEKFLYRVYIVNSGRTPDNSEIESLISQIIDDYISELLSDAKNKSARLLHLIDRLKATALSIIKELLDEFSDSSFKPEFFEMRIGTKETPSVKLTLKDGTKISLSGIIDRVDVYRNNGKAYIRVVDYKTGNKTFSVSDIKEGLNLQMLLYIFSLTRGNKEQLSNIFGGEPIAAGITYLSFDSSKSKGNRLLSDGNDNKSNSSIIRTGLILNDEEVITAISHSSNDRVLMRSSRKSEFIDESSFTLLYDEVCGVLSEIGEEMVSGDISADPKEGADTCKYCRFYTICRTSQKK